MLTLWCALVGVKGSTFSIEIDASESVGDLKKAIRKKVKNLRAVNSAKLQLFLARKRDDAWSRSKDPAVLRLEEGKIDEDIQAAISKEPMDATKTLQHALLDKCTVTPLPTDEIHVLVVVPPPPEVGGKRVRVDDWFADEEFCTHKKKQKLGEEDGPDQFTRYFEMADFPPLLHPMQRYNKIVERDAYVVIFAELMSKVKQCFEVKSGANMIVTGNPGIGKSRFYLYCIFQLLFGQRADVKELGSFDLVLNADNIYHKFRAESNQFVELDTEQVRALSQQLRVLRLIDGKSSTLTGWRGVSILFACPDLDGIKNYAKVMSFTYILPVWSLEELEEYNSLLDDDDKLPHDVLISRYDKFGGIPQHIFTLTELENEFALKRAISSFSALDAISYAERNLPVTYRDFSDRVFAMVPSERDYRAEFHLDFLSNYIAKRFVAKVDERDRLRILALAFAHANNGSGGISVIPKKMSEMLRHS